MAQVVGAHLDIDGKELVSNYRSTPRGKPRIKRVGSRRRLEWLKMYSTRSIDRVTPWQSAGHSYPTLSL
jgi:hypothetical protein